MKSIFITVRTGSTRLRNKCLLDLDGQTSISYLINRLKHSKNNDNIILCTTFNPGDDILVDIAKNNDIEFFRGSDLDKLERWNGACEQFGTKFFVTADGDDTFCDPFLIDLAFSQYEKNDSSFIESEGILCGAFTNGISRNALKKVCEIKNTKDTEMIWPYFKETNLFKVEQLKGVDKSFFRDDIRLTLDYQEDLDFMRALISKRKNIPEKGYFRLEEIISIVDQYPDLLDINFFRHKEWADNQVKKTKLRLIK